MLYTGLPLSGHPFHLAGKYSYSVLKHQQSAVSIFRLPCPTVSIRQKIRAVSLTASAPDHSGKLCGGERAQRRKGQTEHIRPYRCPELRLFAETFRAPSRSKEFPRCLSGSRLTVLSFPNHCHFLSGLCRDCTDHIPCLRNLPPIFRHFPRTAIRKPDSLTAPSVYRKPDGKRLANPHGTLPRKHPFF